MEQSTPALDCLYLKNFHFTKIYLGIFQIHLNLLSDIISQKKAQSQTNLNLGVGWPCAWQSRPKLFPSARVNELLFKSVENVGAFAPTGSGEQQIYSN
jgi:hypothetical protein